MPLSDHYKGLVLSGAHLPGVENDSEKMDLSASRGEVSERVPWH